MTEESIERNLTRLAATQHGVFSREQARAVGVTRSTRQRRLASARWESLHPGVYRIAGSPRTVDQSMMAASLAWGNGTAVSHRAAAGLFRLAGSEPRVIEVTTPDDRRRRNVKGVITYHSALPRQDVTSVGPIPVTTPTRTLIDLAAVAPRDFVEEALDDALRRGMTSLERLRSRLHELGRQGRPGTTLMRALLDARDPTCAVPQSVMETRLRRILKQAGLPTPVLQYPVRQHGKVVAVIDFAYPEQRIAIEAIGYRWHSGLARWRHDVARQNALTALGWRMIYVTWHDMTNDEAAAVRRIRAALSAALGSARSPPAGIDQ